MEQGFAIWITGLPAAGKSSVARELSILLRERGIPVVVLESDVLRAVLAPEVGYGEEERDRFYRMFAETGEIITKNGVPVIFDATANLRRYRDSARRMIPRFLEVFLDCPLEVCRERDPKGIYARSGSNEHGTVPGVQAPYEPPLRPDVVLGFRTTPSQGAELILSKLGERGIIPI